MFVELSHMLRRFANKSIIRKLLKIRVIRLPVRYFYSLLERRAYSEIVPIISKGPVPITVYVGGGITVDVHFSNQAQYFQYSESNTEEMLFIAYILEHISTDAVVYDIGANIGVFTMFFAKYAKKVVSFEPFPNSYKQLEKNIEKNGLGNVRGCETAICDSNGTGRLFFPAYAENETSQTALASLSKVVTSADVTSKEVSLATLDKAIEKYGLPLPDAIKIDIEGAEYAALVGMEETLKKTRAQLFVEVHPSQIVAMGASEQSLYDLLERYGYAHKMLKGNQRYSSEGKHIHAWHPG